MANGVQHKITKHPQFRPEDTQWLIIYQTSRPMVLSKPNQAYDQAAKCITCKLHVSN